MLGNGTVQQSSPGMPGGRRTGSPPSGGARISTRMPSPRVCSSPRQTGATGLPRAKQEMMSRSEEHTSELQSRENLVCRLLLEKKKNVNVNLRLLPLPPLLVRHQRSSALFPYTTLFRSAKFAGHAGWEAHRVAAIRRGQDLDPHAEPARLQLAAPDRRHGIAEGKAGDDVEIGRAHV